MKPREYVLDLIRQHPALFYRVMPYRKRYSDLLIHDDTRLVVEGYPRSANTYAVAALWVSNGRQLQIARHTHAVAQLRRAHDRKLPTLLLIRKPEDAILSYVIREPKVDIPLAIRRYLNYYQAANELKEGVVVSDFDTTISRFGDVVDALNQKFGLTLNPFENNEKTQQKITRLVEMMEKKDSGGSVSELKVARPSEKRNQLKEQLREELTFFRRKLELANDLYARIRDSSSLG